MREGLRGTEWGACEFCPLADEEIWKKVLTGALFIRLVHVYADVVQTQAVFAYGALTAASLLMSSGLDFVVEETHQLASTAEGAGPVSVSFS